MVKKTPETNFGATKDGRENFEFIWLNPNFKKKLNSAG